MNDLEFYKVLNVCATILAISGTIYLVVRMIQHIFRNYEIVDEQSTNSSILHGYQPKRPSLEDMFNWKTETVEFPITVDVEDVLLRKIRDSVSTSPINKTAFIKHIMKIADAGEPRARRLLICGYDRFWTMTKGTGATKLFTMIKSEKNNG